jgi:hypothetical protein
MSDDKVMRSFDTGATRDTAEGKLDMEGFTHPMVMKQFAKYMNMNRLQSDGQLRDSDNWQKGIPIDAYMKSLKRHVDELWQGHRGFPTESGMIAALCGIMFNSMGMLHEILKESGWQLQDFDDTQPTPEMKGRQDALRRKGAMNAKGQLLLEAPEKEDIPDSFCGSVPDDDRCHDCTPQCDYNIPKLPVCYGWCGGVECGKCSNKPECDALGECHDCDLRAGCANDWGRGAQAAREPLVTPVVHTFEPPAEEVLPVFKNSGCNGCMSRMKLFSLYPCNLCFRNNKTSFNCHDYYVHQDEC